MEHLIWLGAICTSDNVVRGGLLIGLFTAGAAGSVMHCAPMCGGFVLGQVSDRVARLTSTQLCEWRRIESGMLLPYHLGRLTTYALLGALAGGSAAIFGRAAWFGTVSAAFLVVAAALFALCALRRFSPRIAPAANWLQQPPAWGRKLGRIANRLPRGSTGGEFLLGLALGFMPCGFLYSALLAAAATGQPATGSAAMVAFGLGTVPALVVVGVAGQAAGRRWSGRVATLAPCLMAANAGLLLLFAWRLVSAP